MRNHLLEEAYIDLQEGKSPEEILLLSEAPNAEQEWVEKNLIKPLSQVISNMHQARSHISSYVSRDAVKEHVEKLEKVKESLLEIWHNIEDIRMSQPGANTPAPSPEVKDLGALVKKLKGEIHPTDKTWVKFSTIEAAKTFIAAAVAAGYQTDSQGATVRYYKKNTL